MAYTQIYSSPWLGSGPAIDHTYSYQVNSRTETTVNITIKDECRYRDAGSWVNKSNTLTGYLWVSGYGWVTIPLTILSAGYQSGGGYTYPTIAWSGSTTINFSVSASTTSLKVTDAKATSTTMQTSGVQASTAIGPYYMTFSAYDIPVTDPVNAPALMSTENLTAPYIWDGSKWVLAHSIVL